LQNFVSFLREIFVWFNYCFYICVEITHLTIKTHKIMENTSSKTKVYNVIIMDRSGSMWDIQKSVIQGYNEVLGGIKADAKTFAETQEHFMTLVLFDSTAIENVYWNEDPNVSVIVTIITDGLENSSSEYSLKAVQALIKHLKAEGWSFAYMGTDHDVDGVTVSLSITNVVKFEKTEAETKAVYEKERCARKRYNDKMALFDMAVPCASAEERKRYRTKISAEYYDESNEISPTLKNGVLCSTYPIFPISGWRKE